MADTTVAVGNKVSRWQRKFFRQYIRENRFNRYMGKGEGALIQLVEDLTAKKGQTVTVSFVGKLTGSGVVDSDTLEGNEEALSNYAHALTPHYIRHGVRVDDNEAQKTEIDMLAAGREALQAWIKEKTKTDIITALGMINIGTTESDGTLTHANGTAYASATEAQKDAFLALNSDRFLFGSLISNASSNDHSTSLGNVDSTDDKLTASNVRLLHRIAQNANPIITPLRVMDDEETYVLFCGTQAFRDLKNDLRTSDVDAGERGKNNPLYRDGDRMVDGVIVRCIPEIGTIAGVGNGGIAVAPVYLCGAQALAIAWAERTKANTKDFDYGFKHGASIRENRTIQKLMRNGKQNGMVTGFFSGVGDS